MNLRYKGEVRLQADKATVWAFLTNTRRIAECLPEAVDVDIPDERHFQSSVPIDVGPLRGRFKVEGELQPDPRTDRVGLIIAGTGFGSSVALSAIFALSERESGTTLLTWEGQADARGTVSMAGRRTVDEHARKIIARGFACLKEQVSGTPDTTSATTTSPTPSPR
jgi:hypothetical protein